MRDYETLLADLTCGVPLDGFGLTRRVLRRRIKGCLGSLVISYADPTVSQADEVVGELAFGPAHEVAFLPDLRHPDISRVYRELHAQGWRYRGEADTLWGYRAWWAPAPATCPST